MPRNNNTTTTRDGRTELLYPTEGCGTRNCGSCNLSYPSRWVPNPADYMLGNPDIYNSLLEEMQTMRERRNRGLLYNDTPIRPIRRVTPDISSNSGMSFLLDYEENLLEPPDFDEPDYEDEPEEYDNSEELDDSYDPDDYTQLHQRMAAQGSFRTYDGGTLAPPCRCCRNSLDEHTRDSYYLQTDNVLNYGYKPRPVFFGDGPLYLGPEIELNVSGYRSDRADRTGRAARAAKSFLGNLGYLKEDGSVDGFEVVTHPMSYSWAMSNFPWDMLPELSRLGCSPGSNCGIHVHVSRAGFDSPCHSFRWIKFFYRNATPIQQIARRFGNTYSQFYRHGHPERMSTKHAVKMQPGQRYITDQYGREVHYPERYSAINVTNPHTFEIRAFASSVSPQEIQAAFGLADATVEYTRSLSSHKILREKAWTWSAFTSWLNGHSDTYRPLMNEMDKLCVY
jgi:hypothetical protein